MESRILPTFSSMSVGTSNRMPSRNMVESFRKKKVMKETAKKPINSSPTVPATKLTTVFRSEIRNLSSSWRLTSSKKVVSVNTTGSRLKKLKKRERGLAGK